MEAASKDYIINTIFRTNIVPLISECNTSCIFCSHKQNPENILVYRMPKLNLQDFEELMPFLSPHKKIVIGESATRIVEGEPLLHPQFVEILTLIRNRFPSTPIQITTNGILLNEPLVRLLEKLGRIELNISVNGATPEVRRKVLGLKREEEIRPKLMLLKDRLKFSGSCVLVPELLDSNELEAVITLLEECGAESVRLFLPGYTARAEVDIDYFETFRHTSELVREIRHLHELPIIVEPAYITDLECRVEGIIKGTPAYRSELRIGDVITHVNGKEARSRVEAFNLAFRLSSPMLTVSRGDEIRKIRLEKPKNTSPGLVVLYDIDPDTGCRIQDAVQRHKAARTLIVTSELAFGIMHSLFLKCSFGFDYEVITAQNNFFGGNIKCAGLLTAQDVIRAVESHLAENARPDLVILPPILFDFTGRDLTGVSMKELEARLGIPVDVG